VFLGDGEMAIVKRTGVEFTDFSGAKIEKASQHVTWDPVMAEKAGYPHFMLKEITSSRGPSAKRCSAGRRRKPARCTCTRWDSTPMRCARSSAW
jgi:glucosamine 6-phosphate synthetase-like amidotransferase/phosphosugar isomerase protein